MSSLGATHSWVAMSYPLLITGSGIIVCILTTLIATDLRPARVVSEIESTLKVQLVVSTLIMTPVSTRGSALSGVLADAVFLPTLACVNVRGRGLRGLQRVHGAPALVSPSPFPSPPHPRPPPHPPPHPQVAYVISICALPSEFTGLFAEEPERAVKNW